MKFVTLLLPALLLGASPTQRPAEPRKYALIVAVGDYPATSGYPKISSGNDVPLVLAALESQGFTAADIIVLRDAEATQRKIFDAMHRMADRARPGDALVFHYSGHGHRVTDDNGDELDGLDEILVPYDAYIPEEGSTAAPSFIRDDALGRELYVLRRKVGAAGSVTVFLDACYSGSATRALPGDAPVRGVLKPITLSGTITQERRTDEDGAGIDDVAQARGGETDIGVMTVISAARHDQVDHETIDGFGNYVGPLSLALLRTLPRLKSGETYRSLHERISLAMAGMNLLDQRPQVEGSVDAKVFSGSLVTQTSYFVVTSYLNDTVMRVRGGTLLGLNPGTRIDLHRVGTVDPHAASPIGTGTVRTADAMSAVVYIDSGSVGTGGWAFVRDYSFGDYKVRVMLDQALTLAQRASVTRALVSLKVAQIVSANADVVVRSFTSDRDLRDRVLSFARSNMLRQLDLADTRMTVELDLVPTQPRLVISGGDTACASKRPVPIDAAVRTAGGITLRPGDEYTFRLTNTGLLPAYVTILDITPDNRINQLFPLPGNTGSDNYLRPGMSYLIPDVCFYADEPEGVEVIKLFATRDRLDFSPVLSGSASRGDLSSPLAQLLSDIYSGERSAPVAVAASGSTSTISVNITGRKRE